MKVKDIMNDNVVKVSSEHSISEVIDIMKDHNVGRVPVIDAHGKVIGIVTDRDLIVSGISKGDDYFRNSVGTIMTTSIVSISSENNVEDAMEVMGNNRIRSLLVIDNSMLVGILTLGDILQTFEYGEQVIKTLNKIYSK